MIRPSVCHRKHIWGNIDINEQPTSPPWARCWFYHICGPDPDDVTTQMNCRHKLLKTRRAVPKTNFKYSYQRCHLRNFPHQWGGGGREMAGLTLTGAVTYPPLVPDVIVRTIRGRSRSRPHWHLCTFSSEAVNGSFLKEGRQFGIEKRFGRAGNVARG